MAVLGVKHTFVCWVRYPRRCCKKKRAGSQTEEKMCMTAWERNAAVDLEKGTQTAPRVIRTGQEAVSRWTGRHGQESSEAYLPKETQALSYPYRDL
jgi:hypothetical protein